MAPLSRLAISKVLRSVKGHVTQHLLVIGLYSKDQYDIP